MKGRTFNSCRSGAIWVRSIALAVCVASGMPDAHAASFDCAKATTSVEKSICSDPELSGLDEKLNQAYLALQPRSPSKEQLRREQSRWITSRNKCTSNDCIRQAYVDRIAALEQSTTNHTQAIRAPCYRFMPERYNSGVVVNKEPVCEALLRNLNEYCAEPPMVCKFKIHPKYAKQFSQAQWKEIHPTPGIDEIERFIKAPETAIGRPDYAELAWHSYRPSIDSAIQRGSLKVDETYADPLNRGRNVRVLRVRTSQCTAKNFATPESDSTLMYRPDDSIINLAPEEYAHYTAGGHSGFQSGHLFRFNDQTFTFGVGGDQVGVNRAEPSSRELGWTNVCIIQLFKWK